MGKAVSYEQGSFIRTGQIRKSKAISYPRVQQCNLW